MKRLVMLLSLCLLFSNTALAAGPANPAGGAKETAAPKDTGPEEAPKSKYLIHLRNGGTVESDNYTKEKNSIRVMLPTGAIYFDNDMVKNIEEVHTTEQDTEGTTVIKMPPSSESPSAEPQRPTRPQPRPRSETTASEEQMDNEGHTESWWKDIIFQWKKKKETAEKKHQAAADDWNKYNGILTSLTAAPPTPTPTPTPAPNSTAQYDLTRYQDLRGAARVEMDRTEAEMNEANKMLNDTLPERARKAGAPPGWLR